MCSPCVYKNSNKSDTGGKERARIKTYCAMREQVCKSQQRRQNRVLELELREVFRHWGLVPVNLALCHQFTNCGRRECLGNRSDMGHCL